MQKCLKEQADVSLDTENENSSVVADAHYYYFLKKMNRKNHKQTVYNIHLLLVIY
jgi:hypothetical protein